MSELNDWFLSLPEARQAVLRDDKWFLAEAAFAAGKASRAQPAQAGQVLTDEEIDAAYEKARADYQRSRFAVRGQQLTAQDSPDWWFARAIEQAVLAKRVPQWLPIETAPKDGVELLAHTQECGALVLYWDVMTGEVDHWSDGMSLNCWKPTHWMPLPPPPGIVGEKGTTP